MGHPLACNVMHSLDILHKVVTFVFYPFCPCFLSRGLALATSKGAEDVQGAGFAFAYMQRKHLAVT